MKHDYTIAIFEEPLAIEVVNSTGVRQTKAADGRQKVIIHKGTSIVKRILAERL